jgi:hypothetical protein
MFGSGLDIPGQAMDQWPFRANKIIYFRAVNIGDLLTSWTTIVFIGRTLLHGVR